MAMIRLETEMKDSGIQWIGDIPNNWNVKPLYACLDEINQKNNPIVTTNILSLTNIDGVIPYSERGNQGNKSKENFEEYKVVYPNTIVANSMNILIGSVGLSKYEGCVSPVYYVYMAKPQVDIRYMNYLFQMEPFQKRLRQFANGILEIRLRVSSHDILHQKVAVPDYDEQQDIADYLDKTCSKIDEIIAEAKSSIDEYKDLKQSVIFETVTKGLDKTVEMKDSGVEWIGKIPATWDALRIKDIGAARNGLTYSPNDQVDSGKGTLVLRSSNVQNGQIVFYDNVYVNKDIPDNLMLDEGDILICSRNGSRRLIGKNAIVPESGKYTFGAFMMVLKPFNDNKKYIHWILNSGVFGYYLPMFFTSTINQLTRENFRNIQIPYCMDVNVQKDIVEYLDKKCELFDSLISEKESLINDLESYKKSLIYEVVTGKRRVV